MKNCIFSIVFVVFVFMLPIPGTIAIRYSLLVVLLSVLLVSLWVRRSCFRFRSDETKYLFIWLLTLTGWIFVQAFLISEETTWAIKEIGSQWVPAILALTVGFGMVFLASCAGWSRQKLLGCFVLVLLLQLLFSAFVSVPFYVKTGVFPSGKTLFTAGKLEISYWNNLLLVFLSMDIWFRWCNKGAISFIPVPILALGMLGVFVSNLAFGARNGIIGALLLLFSLLVLMLWYERKNVQTKKTVLFVAAAIFLACFLAWANYRLDDRWASFEETAKVAWDLETRNAWLHPDDVQILPLDSGGGVDGSAYMRIAWIHAGLNQIVEYPWGVGYGRNAFGHALRKTMETRLGHAHSGIIDWTIGVGIPGLMLWIGFFGWMIWVGGRCYFVQRDPIGLILVFVVGGFFGRMLLDSVNRDHMLMLFFLVLGMLFALIDSPVVEEGSL